MEGKKEFLTEENYERGNKKIRKIALIVLIIGLLIGGSLIATGIIKSNNAKKHNEQIAKQVEQNNQTRSASEVQSDIDLVKTKIDKLEKELRDLRIEQDKIFSDDRGFSDRYYKIEAEINEKTNEMNKLRSQLFKYESELLINNSGYNDTQKEIEKSKNTISSAKYTPFYMFGGFIIFASCMFSGIIYLSTKQRELMAYQVQKVMPIAQEGLEKMAPTIGKAGASIAKEIAPEIGKAGANVAKEMAPVYGDIAKEISKGVKEGLKDEEKK